MREIVFRVQGSADEPYEVIVSNGDKGLVVQCTCQAGLMRQTCKHKTLIVQGLADGLVSDNAADLAQVVAWMRGSAIEAAMAAVAEAEVASETAKQRLSAAKKALAAALWPKGA